LFSTIINDLKIGEFFTNKTSLYHQNSYIG